MSDTIPEAPPSARKRWATLLVRLAGLALLVFVVSKVAFRDTVVLADGTRLAGAIVDEVPRTWDAGEGVRFVDAEGRQDVYDASELRRDESTGLPDVNEGLIRIVRRSDKLLLFSGLVLFGAITQIGVLRWWLLLRAQGIHVPYGQANRLTFIGFFFNNVVPGATGGDLVKALYVSRRTQRRTPAIVTVLVDRVVGLVALALIAALALLFQLEEPQYRELAAFIGIFLGSTALAAVLFFSRRVRRLLRVENLSTKLPGGGLVRKVDEAIFQWRHHKGALGVALLLSFANQLSIQGMMLVFAEGLHLRTTAGEALPWTSYMVVLPVAFIVSALPLLPGGWGVREAAFAVCFGYVGVERNPAIALSVLNGVTSLFWSLIGGVYFLLDRGARPTRVPAPTP